MAHISKQQLSQSQLEKLFLQLSESFAKLNAQNSSGFLDNLLGPEEKIMLAKRLAAIVMFIEGNSLYRVSQLLLISPSTAARIQTNYQKGRYREIESWFKSHHTDYEAFWKTLEIILRAGMPPMGRGRWKSVFQRL